MIGRVLLSLAGAGFFIAGFRAKVENDNLLQAVAADPVCTHALTLATPPRSGRTCSVEAATIVTFFSSGFHRHALPGSRATVEHVAGGTAFAVGLNGR